MDGQNLPIIEMDDGYGNIVQYQQATPYDPFKNNAVHDSQLPDLTPVIQYVHEHTDPAVLEIRDLENGGFIGFTSTDDVLAYLQVQEHTFDPSIILVRPIDLSNSPQVAKAKNLVTVPTHTRGVLTGIVERPYLHKDYIIAHSQGQDEVEVPPSPEHVSQAVVNNLWLAMQEGVYPAPKLSFGEWWLKNGGKFDFNPPEYQSGNQANSQPQTATFSDWEIESMAAAYDGLDGGFQPNLDMPPITDDDIRDVNNMLGNFNTQPNMIGQQLMTGMGTRQERREDTQTASRSGVSVGTGTTEARTQKPKKKRGHVTARPNDYLYRILPAGAIRIWNELGIQPAAALGHNRAHHVIYSHAPPASVDLRLLGDVYVTAVELLTFFPDHLVYWPDYLRRLASADFSNADIVMFTLSSRGFLSDQTTPEEIILVLLNERSRVSHGRGRMKLNVANPNANRRFKNQNERPKLFTDLTCANWVTPRDDRLRGPLGGRLIDYYVSDLADGVVNLPTGTNAGPLTEVIRYVQTYTFDPECQTLKLSDVPAFAKARGMFKTAAEAGLHVKDDVPGLHADLLAVQAVRDSNPRSPHRPPRPNRQAQE